VEKGEQGDEEERDGDDSSPSSSEEKEARVAAGAKEDGCGPDDDDSSSGDSGTPVLARFLKRRRVARASDSEDRSDGNEGSGSETDDAEELAALAARGRSPGPLAARIATRGGVVPAEAKAARAGAVDDGADRDGDRGDGGGNADAPGDWASDDAVDAAAAMGPPLRAGEASPLHVAAAPLPPGRLDGPGNPLTRRKWTERETEWLLRAFTQRKEKLGDAQASKGLNELFRLGVNEGVWAVDRFAHLKARRNLNNDKRSDVVMDGQYLKDKLRSMGVL